MAAPAVTDTVVGSVIDTGAHPYSIPADMATTGPVHISLLGVVRGHCGTTEVVLAGSQPRLVLALLGLNHGRPVRADELAEVLWPEGRASHWEGAIRGVISKLRAFLSGLGPAAPRLDNVGHTYRLVCGDHATIDIWHAERQVAEAASHMAAGMAGEAATVAESAAVVLTDRLLPGHDGEWLEGRREQFSAMRRRALRLAAVANTACGDHDKAIRLAADSVSGDLYDEESHRVLMAAHLAAGNRAAALRAYGNCRRVLAEDLGVSPSAETEALYLRLLAPEPGGIAPPPRPTRRLLPLVEDRPFVGRDPELAAIAECWEAARSGSRQVVLVRGEAGIGKTRTGLEAVRRMEAANVLYGRSSAEQIIAFEPFVEAIGRFAERLGDDEVARLIDGFEPEIVSLVPSLAARHLNQPLGADLGDTPPSTRPTLFESITAVLARVTRAPTVLALDDLQWADPSSLSMLRHIVRRLDQAHLLVLVTYRDDCRPSAAMADAISDLHRTDGCRSVRLGGLGVHDIADLLRLAAVPNADQVGEVLRERTGGNSFYVTQVLSAAAEAPAARASFDPLHVPDNVSEVVRHRTATLSAAAQQVLAMAAVIGTGVPRRYLEPAIEVVGGSVDAVEELIGRRFLLEDVRGDFGFAHGIVRDAVYGRLSLSRRRQLHHAVASALLAHGTGQDLHVGAALAHHLDLADDPSNDAMLADACRRAGDHAMGIWAYEQAAGFYRRALAAHRRCGPDSDTASVAVTMADIDRATLLGDVVERITETCTPADRPVGTDQDFPLEDLAALRPRTDPRRGRLTRDG